MVVLVFRNKKNKNLKKIKMKLKILKIIQQIIFSFPVTALDLPWIQGNLLIIGTGNKI